MEIDISAVDKTIETLRQKLLSLRSHDCCWRGRLSDSALSTATAVFALVVVDKHRYLSEIDKGLSWLRENQNNDGGWGDTSTSPSNLSTTLLCRCALGVASDKSGYSQALGKADAWLVERAGGLEPELLAAALDEKYGDDKSFSVPILTMCAFSGLLGEGQNAWRLVKSLPFELAVFPHQFYKWLRLPVVSYALPALIAIGQAKFHHLKPRNPFARLLRQITRGKSLEILARLQPENGGFLEATPLTAFVVMSLAAGGYPNHPVVEKGTGFLIRSMREDGGWPIDTDLASWVTTLSVGAFAEGGDLENTFSQQEQEKMMQWLLDSQHRRVHPYTRAAAGGWAWTNLPGAVPDADDTSGVLLALRNLDYTNKRVRNAVDMGMNWLLNIQNADGGIPTFCRGWSKLPFDRSAPDITAHALAAMAAWFDFLPAEMQVRLHAAIDGGLKFLISAQRKNGSWIPLWFGNQCTPAQENPVYGTAKVMTYLLKLPLRFQDRLGTVLEEACRWLLEAQNKDDGWGGSGCFTSRDEAAAVSSIEETALSVDALAELLFHMKKTNPGTAKITDEESIKDAVTRGLRRLISDTNEGTSVSPSPIGLYFASLWYSEELYPIIFSLSALNKLRRLI